jgi:drug/metabolite transporter (DMT)-like permease
MIVSKIVLSGMEIPPIFYAAVRYALVGLIALPWLFPIPKPWWRIALVGFLMGGGGFALLFAGIKTVTPSSAAIVYQLGLPMTALLSVIMLGETIDWRRGTGMALTFVGVIMVMLNPEGFVLSGGLLFVAGSALAGSLAAVMMKQMQGVRPMQFQSWVGLASMLPLGFLTTVIERNQIQSATIAGWPLVAAVLFSAVIVSILSHSLYYSLIARYEANMIAPLLILNPLMTIVLGIIVTDDHFDLRIAFGTVIALLGLIISSLRRNHAIPSAPLLKNRFR